MPTFRRTALVAETVLLVAGARDGLAQSALAGVRTVAVVVETLNPDAAKISLTESDLRTKVEPKLRMAGLRVAPAPAGLPVIYVRVSVQAGSEATEGLYVCNVELTLYENVELPRTRTLVPANLWSDGSLGNVGSNRARGWILELLDQKVDAFLNAWLAANPK